MRQRDTGVGSADLIVEGAEVLGTRVAANGDSPTAVAVADDRILAVGGAELRELADTNTRIIDAGGGAIIPGINDAHLHFTASAMVTFGYLPVGSAGSWPEVAALLRQTHPGTDGWVRAHGWDETTLGPGGEDFLKECRSDVPVVAFDRTGHQLLANSKALQLAGLTNRTPDSPGGVIGRDSRGNPTGLLKDGSMALLVRALPPVPRPQMRNAMLKMQARLHAQGITSLTEPGLGPGSPGLMDGSGSVEALELLGELAEQKELSLRISVLMLFAGTGGATAAAVEKGLASGLAAHYRDRGIDDQQLRIAGVKVFADGIPRSGTAWMHEPYGPECTHGSLVIAGDSDEARSAELSRILTAIHRCGLQAGIHATGDAATEVALRHLMDLEERDRQVGKEQDNRHYIIHGSFTDMGLFRLMSENGIGYSTNPLIRFDAAPLMRRVLGSTWFRGHQPLNTALGAQVAFNIASDAPVTSTDWRRSIVAATTRATSDAAPDLNDPECITSLEALSAMTALPAWQDHAESYKGLLHPGMVADLCVLDGRWPQPGRIDQLLDRKVLLTLSNGVAVHDELSN